MLLSLALASCNLPAQRSSTPGVLQQAAELYRDARPDTAIRLINTWLDTGDRSPEQQGSAYSLLGDIHYSMQDYVSAGTFYRQARLASPSGYHALHRYWAAMLMQHPDKQTRDNILGEIEALANNPHSDARALLAAYTGYTYFWQQEKRVGTLTKLLQAIPDPDVERELPWLIMEEMIYSESAGLRFDLAKQFFNRFPDHVNLPTIASMVFSTSDVRPDARRFLDLQNKKASLNPYMRFYLARYLLLQKKDRQQALSHIRVLLNDADLGKSTYCNDPDTLRTCNHYRNLLLADVNWLYAQLLLEQGDVTASLDYADRATSINPLSAPSWRLKGRLYARMDKPQLARQALIRSLDVQPDHESTVEFLRSLDAGLPVSKSAITPARASNRALPVFSDITAQTGLANQAAQRVAWGDINNDGFDDLLVDGNRLFLNVQGKRFRNITSAAGIPGKQATSGGLFVDYDNDGLLDILVTGHRSALYKNVNGTTFRQTHTFNRQFPRRTVAASVGDFNNDGYMDVYLANYEKKAVERGVCYGDQLFINQGGKRFRDLSHILEEHDPFGLCGRGVIWTDLNQDGRQEIVVSNYRLNRNALYRRTDPGRLRDISRESGFQGAINGNTIATVSADFDGDGKADLYQTSLAHPRYLQFSDTSHLFLNRSPGADLRFSIATQTGIAFDETNADITAGDFDNDGDIDLFVTSIYRQRFSSLYLNDGKAQFTNASWRSGAQVANAWGSAGADFDRDGDVDLVVASADGIRLLRNDSDERNSLGVTMRPRHCQRNGIGARLWLTAGSRSYYREIQAGKGTGTQDSATVSFGLGKYRGNLSLRAVDTCGNEYRWTGAHNKGNITIS